MRLLPRSALTKTGPVDHADWNYRPILAAIQRKRFELIVTLLGTDRYPRLLEIGYGSGVFMPELSRLSGELYGIDIHSNHNSVARALEEFNVTAQLFSGTAEKMPFPEGFFDCIVAVSALEFIDDLEAACREIKRILKPGGCLVTVTPGRSPVLDFGLRLLTGQSAKNDFGRRRERVIPALMSNFRIEEELSVPSVLGSYFRLYTGFRLTTLRTE